MSNFVEGKLGGSYMVCKKCGKEIYDGEKFCSNCGYQIKKTKNKKEKELKLKKKVIVHLQQLLKQ